jgi:hypothetical protein
MVLETELRALSSLYFLSHAHSPFVFSLFFKWCLLLLAPGQSQSVICLLSSWDYSSDLPAQPGGSIL